MTEKEPMKKTMKGNNTRRRRKSDPNTKDNKNIKKEHETFLKD